MGPLFNIFGAAESNSLEEVQCGHENRIPLENVKAGLISFTKQ